jgi:methylated-DNA-[protein]-cysteine S-methyltransferase
MPMKTHDRVAAVAAVYCWYPSPVGRLLLASDGAALVAVGFGDAPSSAVPAEYWREDPLPLDRARRQLDEYFAGTRRTFDLPVKPLGTHFQMTVWSALQEIPYGTTWSYRRLAVRVGRERAVRAVGLANGRNPLAIVIPCHRVIGSNGSLTGFAGGIEAKAWLLVHERRVLGEPEEISLFR